MGSLTSTQLRRGSSGKAMPTAVPPALADVSGCSRPQLWLGYPWALADMIKRLWQYHLGPRPQTVTSVGKRANPLSIVQCRRWRQ